MILDMDPRNPIPGPSTFSQRISSRRLSSSSSTHSASSTGAEHITKKPTQRSTRSKGASPSKAPFRHFGEEEKPVLSIDLPGPGNTSRRESASSMRTSSTMETPVTYTPTTHRISKAKKGKRVHACEFPGCNKIFTRAEHRRRHELNHSPEASFPCARPNCRKAFHRPDLLARHMERHELEDQAETSGTPLISHRRSTNSSHFSSEMSPAVPSQQLASPPLISMPAQPHSSNPLDIGSIVNHPQGNHSIYGTGHTLGYDYSSHSSRVYPFGAVGSSDESNYFYSSPESSQSPISDHFPRQPHRNSLSSVSSGLEMYPTTTANTPLLGNNNGGWTPAFQPLPTPSHGIEDDGSALPSVDHPIQLPLSVLDGDEWFTLRRELGSTAGVIPDNDGVAVIDTVNWEDCVELYKRHFIPLFPVSVVPMARSHSFWTSNPPCMISVMVAGGSQYHTRPNSKEYAMALLEASSRILNKRGHTTSQQRLADLQTVFILEALAKFRSRRADVEMSSRFRFLYASLAQARHWVSTSPLAVLKSVKGTPNPVEIRKAHSFWVDHETRRRIFNACFILDTLQSTLFGKHPVLSQAAQARSRTIDTQLDMPFPCPPALWDASSEQSWAGFAASFMNQNLSLQAATAIAISSTPEPLDMFQSLLVFSHILMHRRHLASFSSDLEMYYKNLALYNQPSSTPCRPVDFTYHAIMAAHYTPVRTLLIVSGESWVFGKKVENEADFHTAKHELREWVDASSPDNEGALECKALKAVWHATRVLSMSLSRPETKDSNGLSSPEFETEDVQWPLNLLHEPWSIYLCGLICWAYGLDSASITTAAATSSSGRASVSSASTTSNAASTSVYSAATVSSMSSSTSSHPLLLPPSGAVAEAQAYLADMTAEHVQTPKDLLLVDQEVRGRTDGLLETIRTRRLSGGDGGLMNEAERVLFRLVEKRGRGWAF